MPVTTVNSSGSALPPYAEEHSKQLLNNVGGVLNPATGQYEGGMVYDDRVPYEGQRLSEFNNDQMRAHELARTGIGGYQPYIDAASASATAGGGQFDPARMDQIQGATNAGMGYDVGQEYLNPYQQNVIDTTMAEMNRQQAIDMNNVSGAAANARSFGGSRHGVVEAEAMGNFDRNRTTALANLNSQNFTQGQAAQEAHRQRQLQGGQQMAATSGLAADSQLQGAQIQAGIGGLNQQYANTDLTTLGAVGDQQQQQQQMGLDIGYEDYLTDQNRPFQMASFYNDMINGVPSSMNSTVQTETADPNKLSQILGGLGTLASAGNNFGWW